MRYGAVNLIHSSKCLINITILAAKAMIRAHKTFISSLAVLNVSVRFIHELKILYSLWRNSFFSFAYGFFRNKNKTFICMVSKNCILVRKKDMSAESDRFGKNSNQVHFLTVQLNFYRSANPKWFPMSLWGFTSMPFKFPYLFTFDHLLSLQLLRTLIAQCAPKNLIELYIIHRWHKAKRERRFERCFCLKMWNK